MTLDYFKFCYSWLWPFEHVMALDQRLKGELGVQVGPDSYILEWALKATAWGHRASPTQGTTSLMDLALLPSLSRVIACYPWLLGYWKFPDHMMLFQAFVISPTFSLECSLFPATLSIHVASPLGLIGEPSVDKYSPLP